MNQKYMLLSLKKLKVMQNLHNLMIARYNYTLTLTLNNAKNTFCANPSI